jgi:hypothetical protein
MRLPRPAESALVLVEWVSRRGAVFRGGMPWLARIRDFRHGGRADLRAPGSQPGTPAAVLSPQLRLAAMDQRDSIPARPGHVSSRGAIPFFAGRSRRDCLPRRGSTSDGVGIDSAHRGMALTAGDTLATLTKQLRIPNRVDHRSNSAATTLIDPSTATMSASM